VNRETIRLLITVFLLIANPGVAQENAAAGTAFNGIWIGTGGGGPPMLRDLPFSEEGRRVAEAYNHAQDNVLKCLIDFGRVTSVRFPMEIIVTDDQVTLLYEYGRQVRRIFLDRPDFSVSYPPNLMGYSIGHWEGNTLVVETRKLETGWATMEGGGPYSDQAVVRERFSLDETGKILTIERTFDDPINYTRPWGYTHDYEPSDWDIYPYDCTIGSYGSAL
jgi:hypothetical protein